MTAITVKNIPDTLYQQLKLSAKQHHRSVNSELIVCLEKVLTPQKATSAQHITAARQIRQRLDFAVTEDELNQAKHQDRP